VARAAAFENRIAAVILDDGVAQLAGLWSEATASRLLEDADIAVVLARLVTSVVRSR
jgi:hypothetical protein